MSTASLWAFSGQTWHVRALITSNPRISLSIRPRTPSTTRLHFVLPVQGPRSNFSMSATNGNSGFGDFNVKEAFERTQNENYEYLDVRTKEEFDASHPAGAKNVPVWIKDSSGEYQPNENFVSDVKKMFPNSDVKLCVGCQSGRRSVFASEILVKEGYTNVSNVLRGFSGWCEESLPTEK